MSGRFAVISPSGDIHNTVIWDGVSHWLPCHEDDDVIACIDEHVGVGDRYENEQFVIVEKPEVIE